MFERGRRSRRLDRERLIVAALFFFVCVCVKTKKFVSNVTLNETLMEETYGEDWANTFGSIFGELDCEECSCACELDPGTVAWVTVCCLVPVILLLACCWCCGCCCFSRRRRSPHAQV